jgi:hypothetical protein
VKRIDFCRTMLAKDDAYLASIWFSDETMVQGRPNGEVVYYRLPEEAEWFVPSNGNGGKDMFWGVISMATYGLLAEVKGKNTAETYIKTLLDFLLPELQVAEGRVVFQQDNASIHKTDAVKAFFTENNVDVLEWPPQSPDLSPIENIWNVMKMKMRLLRKSPHEKRLPGDLV